MNSPADATSPAFSIPSSKASASGPSAVNAHGAKRSVFVSGGTGYLGVALISELIARGHQVRTLVRRQSLSRAMKLLPAECKFAVGDALDHNSFRHLVQPCDTFVQMVGVAHPNPSKAAEFCAIDLRSVQAGLEAAVNSTIAHFVYLSVAQTPSGHTPVMRAYVESRRQAESLICNKVAAGKMSATFLRPWYVLGPGHRWPILLKPLYWAASLLPSLRESARTMGLVSRREMIAALVHSIEFPAESVAVIDVEGIRRLGKFVQVAR